MKLADLPEARQLASDLSLLKDKMGRLGLFESMHLMDAPLQKIGFEIEQHLLHHAREAASDGPPRPYAPPKHIPYG